MSVDSGNSSASRLSNGSYPASDDSGRDAAESDAGVSRPPELPTVEERIGEIVRTYPERVLRPVSSEHGRKLREEAFYDPETVLREVETGPNETATVADVVSRGARPWIDVIERFLRDYESYRDKYLRMAKGAEGTPEREEFLVKMNNSFSPEYQTKQYARLKAMKRQFMGESADESPTGEEFAGEFEEPVTVLFGLTGSSTTADDKPRPVVDHDREIREAWGGSDGVRRTLRYVLQEKLGLSSSEYAWWFQSEPHPGGGAASGYSHSHPVVILDAAAVSTGVDPESPETYRAVVAKHVAECPSAEWSAHRIRQEGKSSVTVRGPGEISDWACYVSEYIAVDPDRDLLERSAEYLMWSASQWVTTTQKYSKSRTATAAIDADACHQQYMDEEANQSADHGERVVRSARRGVEFECACCGSEFAVDQAPETLTAARLSPSPSIATDGGEEEEEEELSLADRWPSAREAASVGAETAVRECDHDEPNTCPLCAESVEAVANNIPIPDSATADVGPVERESVTRPPTWKPEAVVSRASGEESLIGTPGGVSYETLVVEGADGIAPEKLIAPKKLRCPNPRERHGIDPTEYPPPELIERQMAEIHHGKPVTAKQWDADWHAERYSTPDAPVVGRARVEEYVALHPGASVVSVMGALMLPPSARSVVEEVCGDVRAGSDRATRDPTTKEPGRVTEALGD